MTYSCLRVKCMAFPLLSGDFNMLLFHGVGMECCIGRFSSAPFPSLL